MKLLITAGRGFNNFTQAFKTLNYLNAEYEFDELVTTNGVGDAAFRSWLMTHNTACAMGKNIASDRHPFEWREYGQNAIENCYRSMLAVKPDLVVIMPGAVTLRKLALEKNFKIWEGPYNG